MATFQKILDLPSSGEQETELTEVKANKTIVKDADSAIDIEQAPAQQTEEFIEEKRKVEMRAAMGGSISEPKEDPHYNESFGCGMSGGGISSAAFCSGVMWALMNESTPHAENKDSHVQLPRGKLPKFYSCVSGGGYIGASFLWWARCNGGGDPRTWQNEYFQRMRRGIGYYIDFTRPLHALLDIFQIIVVIGVLIASSVVSFVPGTYVLCELLSYPYVCDGCDNAINQQFQTMRLLNDGVMFVAVFFSIPVLAILRFITRAFSLSQLQAIFLTDVTSKKLSVTKTLREMVTNVYWYVMNIFATFVFVMLWDFSALLEDDYITLLETQNFTVDIYNTTLANAMRIVILCVVFYRAPDLIGNFVQAQVIIWAYRSPHHFFGYPSPNFKKDYELFAITCKILLPFVGVMALFRERALLEFVRYRISKAFFDVPVKGTRADFSLEGAICGIRFGENAPRKLFWTPSDKNANYPVYISGTTVNKWMVIPEATNLFPVKSLQRELEARYYFENMPDDMKPSIERILSNGEDRVAKDQQVNELVVEATATESDPNAPLFFKQRPAHNRAEILTFLQKSMQAHSLDSDKAREMIESDMSSNFQLSAFEVNELLSWLSGPQSEPKRRLTLPQADTAKRFIGDVNITFIEDAIKLARSVTDPKLVEDFEARKGQEVSTLRRSLRDLVWRNITPESAGTDVLALSSEGWWERYEVGLNEPIYILPPPVSKTEETVHNKLDALIGANPDITLSEAVGMSAAMGSFTRAISGVSLRTSQVLLGLHMGRWVNTVSLHWLVQVTIMIVFELLLSLPVIIQGGNEAPLLRGRSFDPRDYNSTLGLRAENFHYWGGIVTVSLYVVWAFVLPLLKNSKFYPFLPRAHLAATLSGEDVWSQGIPSMLYLSNGGDSEKLGLLPLLARRSKWIVLASGERDCESLHSALDQARVKLGVAFRELESDQRRRHMHQVANEELDLKSDIEYFARDGSQRVIVFEVLYPRAIRSWKKSAGSFAPSTLLQPPQQKGYIFFMRPTNAYPDGFRDGEKSLSSDARFGAECVEHLDRKHESLAGCCCRCCHRFSMFKWLGGEFPYHHTGLFTPTLFDAYHVQGVQAMRDAFKIILEHQVKLEE